MMAKPLLDVHCVCDSGYKYPTCLKVAMDDGTVQTYVLHVEQQPNFTEAMQALDRMMDMAREIGYKYSPKRNRRNR